MLAVSLAPNALSRVHSDGYAVLWDVNRKYFIQLLLKLEKKDFLVLCKDELVKIEPTSPRPCVLIGAQGRRRKAGRALEHRTAAEATKPNAVDIAMMETFST